jgi:long-chain acyl-CoA synthetase
MDEYDVDKAPENYKIPIDLSSRADSCGIKLYTFNEVLAKGIENQASFSVKPPTPDDSMMFSYTSGTTGDPKGVKLTHKMICQTSCSINLKQGNNPLNESDSYISYLPAAHSFEQALFGTSMIYGMKCGFFSGDPLKLVSDDLPCLRPTMFPSVPRLYNRIYGKIKDTFNLATGVKGSLIKQGVAAKLAKMRNTGSVTHCLWDKIIFKKVKQMMGGNVRTMLTASAPISCDVLDFLKVCFCCPIYEGYGMTETCGGSVCTVASDPLSGHVGGPVANVKIRLKDVPEMNYMTSNDPPQGEVCFWGPSIMKGYFKNPEKTAETIVDGWLYSGDVGQVYPNGSIKIIDRAKNIFKLSQGEYLAPEKLEGVYVQSPYIL